METPVPDTLPDPAAAPAETAKAAAASADPIPAAESIAAEERAAIAEPEPVAVTESIAIVESPAIAEPEAPPGSPFGVGPALRAARAKMGKSLADCSKQLRIRQPFLEALEDGRHADLPGGTYAAGFLRTYSEYLGLDGEELVRRFRDEGAGGFTARAELSFPSPVTEGRIPGGAVIFLGIVLAAVAYGGWYMLSFHESKVAEMVPPLPDRLSTIFNRQAALTGDAKAPPSASDVIKPGEEQAVVKEDVVPPAEVEEDKTAAAAPVQPMVAPVEQTSAAPTTVEPPKTETPKAETPKAEAPKAETPKAETPKVETDTGNGKVFGAEYTDARVVLRANSDDCWVQVREMDGSLLVSRLLRRGDSYRVPNRPGLTLMVGNAGSLEVSVDGHKGPALGAIGQVRRDIRLDPDTLMTGG